MLEGLEEVQREQVGLLGKVLGPLPVGSLYGLLRLVEEAANFVDHIFLSGVQIVAVGMVQILLGCGDELVCLLLKLRLIRRRDLRRDLRGGRAFGFGGWGRGDRPLGFIGLGVEGRRR